MKALLLEVVPFTPVMLGSSCLEAELECVRVMVPVSTERGMELLQSAQVYECSLIII